METVEVEMMTEDEKKEDITEAVLDEGHLNINISTFYIIHFRKFSFLYFYIFFTVIFKKIIFSLNSFIVFDIFYCGSK